MNSELANACRPDAGWQTGSSINGISRRIASYAAKYKLLMEAGGGSLAKENRNAGNIDFGDGKGYKHKNGKASNGRGK